MYKLVSTRLGELSFDLAFENDGVTGDSPPLPRTAPTRYLSPVERPDCLEGSHNNSLTDKPLKPQEIGFFVFEA